ncbi:MAG: OmpA family protein [Bacteroidales bacterium]
MKILMIGFLVFSGWSSLSTCIYVCKIKGLCDEPKIMLNNEVVNSEIVTTHTPDTQIVSEIVKIPENLVVYFAFDKSELNNESESNEYLDKSRKYLEQNLQARINITGHTDAVGTNEYNQALGYRRAESMQRFFKSSGVPANKITIESKGEKDPAEDNNTEAGRAKNRRAEITIIK